MKLIKASLLMHLTIIALEGKSVFAGNGENLTANAASLNYQLVKEIKEVLETPLLVYSDRDLNGIVYVTAKVETNGKINFIRIESENVQLNNNTLTKLNELNLWTGKDLAGKVFKYEITYTQ